TVEGSVPHEPLHNATSDYTDTYNCYDGEAALQNNFRSTQFVDIINDNIGNSHFDAIRFLRLFRKSSPTKFNFICDELKIARINNNDVDFMEEYCSVMEPVAISLSIHTDNFFLSIGENNMYFGFLLPTINELSSKLEAMSRKQIVYCQLLVIALYDGMNKKFGALEENNFLIIAA
ncbi:Uncharacterized protein FWK35_00032949, partial [Aphis craccivora]